MPVITPPPRLERWAAAAGYLVVGVAGISALFIFPSRMTDALGWIILFWGAFILTAIPAAVARFRGRYGLEYACLPWFAGAVTIAVAWMWFMVLNGDAPPGRAMLVSALPFAYLARWATLRNLVKLGYMAKRGSRWKPHLRR